MMSWPSHRRCLFWSKVCWFLIHARVVAILQHGNDVGAFSSYIIVHRSNGYCTTSCSSSSRITISSNYSSLFSTPPNKNYNERSIRGTDNNDDEPLSFRFQRAVVLQRAGEYTDALQEYQMFVKAAESCNVSPELYAEVHVNMGAIFMKWKNWSEARTNFEKALNYREDNNMASAHVNLALLTLAEGRQQAAMSSSSSLSQASSQKEMNDISRQCLKQAWGHCKQALSSVNQDDDDMVHSATRMAATRLMRDIEAMLKQIGEEIPPSN